MAENNSYLLDIDTIINKQFNIEFKGYSPIEVDQFLDAVAHDYEAYAQTVSELNDKVSFYQENVSSLKSKIMELENRLKEAEDKASASANPNSSVSSTNLSQVDILRRLARLEQEVFNRR